MVTPPGNNQVVESEFLTKELGAQYKIWYRKGSREGGARCITWNEGQYTQALQFYQNQRHFG